MGRPPEIATPMEVTTEARRVVARMRAEGAGGAAIGRAVGLSSTTVYRILETET